jgi:hypothetical protein
MDCTGKLAASFVWAGKVTGAVIFWDNADASVDIAVACANIVEGTIGVSSEHRMHVCDALGDEVQFFCTDEFVMTALLDCWASETTDGVGLVVACARCDWGGTVFCVVWYVEGLIVVVAGDVAWVVVSVRVAVLVPVGVTVRVTVVVTVVVPVGVTVRVTVVVTVAVPVVVTVVVVDEEASEGTIR